MNMANGAFVRELCDSRTFCRQADVDAMLDKASSLRRVSLGTLSALRDLAIIAQNGSGARHDHENE